MSFFDYEEGWRDGRPLCLSLFSFPFPPYFGPGLFGMMKSGLLINCRMWARPALKKGANVPDPYKLKELLQDKEKMEKYAAESRKWVQQGMAEDAKKNAERSSK